MYNDTRQCFLMVGDGADGMSASGPFDSYYAALQYRDLLYDNPEDLKTQPFQIVPFIPPDWGETKKEQMVGDGA